MIYWKIFVVENGYDCADRQVKVQLSSSVPTTIVSFRNYIQLCCFIKIYKDLFLHFGLKSISCAHLIFHDIPIASD